MDEFPIPLEVLNAMMTVESSGNPNATSPKGARGLFQILPSTAMDYGVTPDRLGDPATNFQLGKRYMSDLMKRYGGDLRKSVTAYHAGMGNVDKGIIGPATKKYVRDVFGKLGGGISSLLGEGTANAEGLPMPKPDAGVSSMILAGGPGNVAEIPSATPSAGGGFAGWKVKGAAPSTSPPTGATGGNFSGWQVRGMKVKGMDIVNPNAPTSAEMSRQQKMSAEATDALQQIKALEALYDSKVAPKLRSGAITSRGQAMAKISPAWANTLGQRVDPDVAEFMTGTGPLSMALNAYYAAQSGGRGGVSLLQQGTFPHAPYAPSSLGADVGEGKWDLADQRKRLEDVRKFIELREGKRTPESFGAGRPADAVRLPSGKYYSPSTKKVYP